MINCHISNLTGGFFNQHEIKNDLMTIYFRTDGYWPVLEFFGLQLLSADAEYLINTYFTIFTFIDDLSVISFFRELIRN